VNYEIVKLLTLHSISTLTLEGGSVANVEIIQTLGKHAMIQIKNE
jgi:hypothetical protein